MLGLNPANSAVYDYSNAYRETRDVSEFNAVALVGSCRVLFTPSDRYEVILEGEKEDVEKYVTEVKGGVLKLYMPSVDESEVGIKGFFGRIVNSVSSEIVDCKVRILISAPDICSLSVSGSGDIEVQKDWTAVSDLDVSVTGSGEVIMGDLAVPSLSVRISGSGCLSSGNICARSMELSITGSGNISIGNADIKDKLKVNMAGSGDVKINGKAGDVVVNISGSGSVKGGLKYDSLDSSCSGSGKISFSNK